MIELGDVGDRTKHVWYLEKHIDFNQSLVKTLNQVDDLNDNNLIFYANSDDISYDYYFNNALSKCEHGFKFVNDEIEISSLNRDDLLNLNYYQKLMLLWKNDQTNFYKWWKYFATDLVIQKQINFIALKIYISIKIDCPLDKYHDQFVKTAGDFINNIINLVTDDYVASIDHSHFNQVWKDQFGNDLIKLLAITFNLKDLENGSIQMNMTNDKVVSAKFKDLLNPNAKLMQYIKNNDLTKQIS